MSNADSIAAIGAIAMSMSALLAAVPFKRHLVEEKIQRQRIQDAILGTPPMKGLPGRSSIFEQIELLQSSLEEIKTLTKQLKPNGGSSLADKVNRISDMLATHLESHSSVEDIQTPPETRQVARRVRRSTPKVLEQSPKEKGD